MVINEWQVEVAAWVVIFMLIFCGFILGWIFPVEGPYDSDYDELVGQRTMKKPVINVPVQKSDFKYEADVEDIKEVLIDLNEDGEQEWYLFMPLLKGEK